MNLESSPFRIHERSQQAKVLLATAAASLAVASTAEQVDAYGVGASSMLPDGDVFSQELKVDREASKAVCRVERTQSDAMLDSQTIKLRVEEINKGSWKVSKDFRRPSATSEPRADGRTVGTTLRAQYPSGKLLRHDLRRPTRLVCVSDEAKMRLPIKSNNVFTKRQIFVPRLLDK